MRFEFPVSYTYSFETPGRLKPTTKYVHDVLEFDIPDVAGGEAPVAVEWTELDYHGRRAGHVEVRYFDGNFYVPASKARGERPEALTADMFPGRADRRTSADDRLSRFFTESWPGSGWPLGNGMAASLGGEKASPLTAAQTRKGPVSTTRERDDIASKAILETLLVVDGCLWRRVAEPVLVATNPRGLADNAPELWGERLQKLVPSTRQFRTAVHLDLPQWGRNYEFRGGRSSRPLEGPDAVWLFAADRMDDLKRAFGGDAFDAGAPLDMHGVAYDVVKPGFEDYRVHMPGVFTFDRETNDVARAIYAAAMLLYKDVNVTMRAGFSQAFHDIEVLHDRYYREGDVGLLAEAAEAVHGLYERYATDRHLRDAFERMVELEERLPISVAAAGFAP